MGRKQDQQKEIEGEERIKEIKCSLTDLIYIYDYKA